MPAVASLQQSFSNGWLPKASGSPPWIRVLGPASVPGASPGETTASGAPGGVKENYKNKGKKKQLVPLVRLRSRHSSLSPLGLDAMLEGLPKVARLRGGGVVFF